MANHFTPAAMPATAKVIPSPSTPPLDGEPPAAGVLYPFVRAIAQSIDKVMCEEVDPLKVRLAEMETRLAALEAHREK
ncbi:MAG: hypothetical protein M1370_01910 [Bacteroidetes bacterium]|nr:hypothetical protein [Bacteroidota bacterium]